MPGSKYLSKCKQSTERQCEIRYVDSYIHLTKLPYLVMSIRKVARRNKVETQSTWAFMLFTMLTTCGNMYANIFYIVLYVQDLVLS